jgi:hypothetical protein
MGQKQQQHAHKKKCHVVEYAVKRNRALSY